MAEHFHTVKFKLLALEVDKGMTSMRLLVQLFCFSTAHFCVLVSPNMEYYFISPNQTTISSTRNAKIP
jgi:hypothetical protein